MDILDNGVIKGLLSHLVEELRTLISREIDLLKAEMTEKASTALKNALTVSIGGGIAVAGVLVLIASAVFALGNHLPLWLSALIIGTILILGGVIAVIIALKNLKELKVEPERSMHSLRQDKDWLKNEAEKIKQ